MRELRRIQKEFWGVIARPLTSDNRTPRRGPDGRPTAAAVGRFIKPNDRLSAVERIQIYHRSYWFRLLDSLYDDCPGLRTLLGNKRFIRLAEAYLTRCPSRSFTMRNLPRRLASFIRAEPAWTRPHTALCADIARFEWAQVVVYDEAELPVFTTDDLLDAKPSRLHLALQPYLQLLQLEHPVDDFMIAVKQQEALLQHASSNTAVEARARPESTPLAAARPPARERCWVGVHRYQGTIYFKRLERSGFMILSAIRNGASLEEAIQRGLSSRRADEVAVARIREWFRTWTELGWFCRRASPPR